MNLEAQVVRCTVGGVSPSLPWRHVPCTVGGASPSWASACVNVKACPAAGSLQPTEGVMCVRDACVVHTRELNLHTEEKSVCKFFPCMGGKGCSPRSDKPLLVMAGGGLQPSVR